MTMGRSTFDTCFYERYARAVIKKYSGSEYADLVNGDRPDLQMEDGSIGIEVTRAMEPSKKAAMVMLCDLTGIGHKAVENGILESLSEEDRELILSSGYGYGVGDGSLIGEKDNEYWSLAQPLREILNSKIQKVDSGFYGKFKHFGLFVFCRYDLSKDEVELIHRHVIATQFNHKTVYETVWLAFTDTLYVCHAYDNSMESYGISKEDACDFFLESLRSSK